MDRTFAHNMDLVSSTRRIKACATRFDARRNANEVTAQAAMYRGQTKSHMIARKIDRLVFMC